MAIQAEHISLGYGGETIIEDLSIRIPAGSFCSVIGPNGCGKSTLVKGLSGNLRLRSGSVRIGDRKLCSFSPRELARKLAYVAQSPHIPDQFSVRELVSHGRFPHLGWMGRMGVHDHEVVEWAMEQTGIGMLAGRDLTQVSGGERQRAWLALALAQEAEILLMDEPTTYLDIAHQFQTLEMVDSLQKETGRTVLMVLHDLNQAARYSDLIFVMQEGRLAAQGPPKEVMTEQMLSEVFSIETRVMQDELHGCPFFIPLRGKRGRLA